MISAADFAEVVRHGFRYGHNHNPAYPELADPAVTADALIQAGPHNQLSKDLIASIQASDGQLYDLVQNVHGRALNIDGDAGPATVALLDIPRCGHPDFEPAGAEEAERSSWVKGCLDEFPGIVAVVMALEVSQMQAAWRDNLPQIKQLLTIAQNQIGFHPVWNDDLSGFANMKIDWGPIGGSVIGWNNVPSSFRCGMTITGKIDTTWNPADPRLRLKCRLGMHEWFGHGCGFGHYSSGPNRPSIMNPSITDGEISWIGDRLESEMLDLFNGPTNPGGGLGDWGTGEWLGSGL